MTSRPRRERQSVDATLAAIATLTAAWPISTLLMDPAWVSRTVLLLAVIALSGIGARSLAMRGWHVVAVQLGCSVLAAGAIYCQGHLWHGLPTFETLRFADSLIREAVATTQRYAAPAPTTPGLIFVVGCSLGLAAVVVDYLAVTRRSPSLAGLPLLTVFLAAVANRGSSLPAYFFLAGAGLWLILVARTGSTIVRRWATTVSVAKRPQGHGSWGVYDRYDHASSARMLGAVALVAAVAVPFLVPHPPAHFLQTGLGRSSSTDGNGSDGVAFTQSLDLSADLNNPSRVPVLQYSTPDDSPPPLRVAVGSYYQPALGLWPPWGRRWVTSTGRSDLTTNPKVPEPKGLSSDVPRRTFVMEVQRNQLQDPYLASPYPLLGADLGGVAWGADYETQSVRVARRPSSYTVSYWHLQPTKAMLRNAPPLSDRDRYLFDVDLTLDGPYVPMVTSLTEQLTTGVSSSYDKAMAIQQYLRADGGFTYSLTLAPTVKKQGGAGSDALSHFLLTKKGYCVQFATAMVMMSRAAGIPARMALGFLPGTESKGVWTVVAADAHAWPELYLDGIGWTRFEPTPSNHAVAPPYAVPERAVVPLPPVGAPTPGSTARARPDVSKGTPVGHANPVAFLSPGSVIRWLTHGWGPALLVLLIALLGSLVVPTAARWQRRRNRSTARTTAAQVEVQWELLTSSLGDLGIEPAPSRTPRQLRAYYDQQALLDGADSQALGRVVQTLERSRYSASPISPTSPDSLSADARQVIKAASATRELRDRLRAAFWPSDGVTVLRSAHVHAASRIRAPLHLLSDMLHRRR